MPLARNARRGRPRDALLRLLEAGVAQRDRHLGQRAERPDAAVGADDQVPGRRGRRGPAASSRRDAEQLGQLGDRRVAAFGDQSRGSSAMRAASRFGASARELTPQRRCSMALAIEASMSDDHLRVNIDHYIARYVHLLDNRRHAEARLPRCRQRGLHPSAAHRPAPILDDLPTLDLALHDIDADASRCRARHGASRSPALRPATSTSTATARPPRVRSTAPTSSST